MVTEVIQARDIKPKLESLIAEAHEVSPDLANRLRAISRWIKNTKPGSLTKKREVMFFLLQLIEDVDLWLMLEQFDYADLQLAFEQLTVTEKYWYRELFPAWFKAHDPKFSTWRKKLMAGEFEAKDSDSLKRLSRHIEGRSGSALLRHICDLSMATDLIVSGNYSKPLCVQLTISNNSNLSDKKKNWRNTVESWGIKRALFLSYNPNSASPKEICNFLLKACDNPDDLWYSEDSINVW